MIRQFDNEQNCQDFVNEAFDKWQVSHVCVFLDGKFLNCFYMSPRQCANVRSAVMKIRQSKQRLYGNYLIR